MGNITIKEHIHDLYKKRQEIDNQINLLRIGEAKKELEENRKKWVGHYFKTKEEGNIKYIKVVNEHADNIYWVTVLVFYEEVMYKYEPRSYTRSFYDDEKIFGNFEDYFITLDDVYITDLYKYKEISKKEYDTAAKKWMDNLLETYFVI